MARDIAALVKQLSLEEKTRLCGGEDFWHLRTVERLGIPQVMVSDGPHGLRKQKDTPDHLGHNDSIKAVCFPAACATASSFDKDLLFSMGEKLGEECQAENVSVLLGPAINIKRSPLCGRNFEYISEDPYLAGKSAAALIKGIQSKNVGTSLKHFAANNQEFFRTTVDTIVDERTLREIYLTGFEIAVKEAQPWTVMCSYNRINGLHASENPWLLTQVLRDEWGFEGFVVSDWYAVNDRVAGLKAGLDLEMPYSGGHNDKALLEAVKNGTLAESVLDTAVTRILTKVFAYVDNHKPAQFDRDKDHEQTAAVEKESAVLLKNEAQALPLQKEQRIAFIGAFAEKPRFQGGGSSHINAHKVTSALAAAKAQGIPVQYAYGFSATEDKEDPAALEYAVKVAQEAEAAVIFAGLPDIIESEGYDRETMRLPACQNTLISAVAAVQPNTIVVLHNGSPVEMPWINQVRSVLELYLGGQALGEATLSLLFGQTNPSGKLAETFPLRLEDTPSYGNFPGNGRSVQYTEGIFVGYRYYDYRKMPVLFPFGHGLSYTTFSYSNLKLDKSALKDTETLTVTVDITNTGKRAGKEIVQLYLEDKTGAALRPIRELKGFEKLSLTPGETKTATFTLDKRSFAWYHTGLGDWYAASGAYDIVIGASSRDLRLRAAVQLTATVPPPFRVDWNTTMDALLKDPRTKEKALKDISERYFNMNADLQGITALGAAAIWLERGYLESPLRNLYMTRGVPYEDVARLIDEFNALLEN
ncbi:MAG: glycoside hydrolase family 3 C-terminal domain-containing protein [Spirochaetaceae bacterium]|jgi:beta-glucosidase|nr:glycoside hydrolase family 3 C-terminal domain-containing protein [Spirochaetaceae bacterium]